MAEENHLVDPETGNRFPVGGCIVNNKQSELPKFGAVGTLIGANLPPSVDLRQIMTPIEHQENIKSW